MVATTFLSGVCMLGVHVFFPFLGKEYSLFATLLTIMNLMAIPGLGLQTVFAQQTAAAVSTEEKDSLTGRTQTLLTWMFFVWLVLALIVLVFQKRFLDGLQIPNPMALWITLAIGLTQLWGPIFSGIMQGQQNFLWMGWIGIFNGLGRFVAIGIIVVFLGGRAAGAIFGTFLGIVTAVALGAFHSRSVWFRPKPAFVFNWKNWLAKIVPLTLGLGAGQFIFAADMIFVRTVFGKDQTGIYAMAGTMGRGLVAFAAPLAMVMFPKIVQNLAHGKRTNVLGYTLLITGLMCSLAASCATIAALLLGKIAAAPEAAKIYLPAALWQRLLDNRESAATLAALIPWFVWCMLPLGLANVLLNNLMARKEFRVVPYLLLVIAAYFTVLTFAGNSFVRVIQILGISNLIFLAVLWVFTPARRGWEIADVTAS